jgi:glycosyltransferase involved in cell wall biosynthesis
MRNLQKPLISIITINLNNASGLSNTLQSLAGQTWENFESIIIDGGSSDGSVEVIKGFSAQKTLRISKWVSEKRPRPVSCPEQGHKGCKR